MVVVACLGRVRILLRVVRTHTHTARYARSTCAPRILPTFALYARARTRTRFCCRHAAVAHSTLPARTLRHTYTTTHRAPARTLHNAPHAAARARLHAHRARARARAPHACYASCVDGCLTHRAGTAHWHALAPARSTTYTSVFSYHSIPRGPVCGSAA